MAKQTDEQAPEPLRNRGMVLLLAAARWRAAAEDVLSSVGVSAIQAQILVGAHVLHTAEGPANQVHIARWAGLDVMTMSKNVRLLEADGLVKRATNPADTRARTVALTPDGIARLRKLEKGLAKRDDRIFGDLGGTQKLRKTLAAFLRMEP